MRKGEEKMKKFNSKKIGIFLGVMLLAGAMVVGPASASDNSFELLAYGHIDHYGSHVSYDGRGDASQTCDYIDVTLKLTCDDSYVQSVPLKSATNARYVTSSGTYYNCDSGVYRMVVH
ncbi:hypothetical protein J2128_002582 [Methanomicrobium sp. W14]|uniref:hypothetical protein n=1 Tax=Methanomicrobium sp. W14 TaxID=2817839 RepID=UPI001AE590F1|nr:hypothetical protein [Methanomicrobium sp. W14]MBP2134606.1 hypothetical protein [Methanomicrobium sp. W14]